MKHRTAWLTAALALALALGGIALVGRGAPVAQAAPDGQAAQYITLVVKAGDNLGLYARTYGVSGAAIMAANPFIKDGNLIYPGQTLVIPVVRTSTPSLTTPFYYTAQAGDLLDAVARHFELDAGAIRRANNVAQFTAGVTYLMPAGPHIYSLQKGDSIASVAARYGVSQQFILNGNTLPNPGVIYAGQPIFVPVIFDARPIPIPGLSLPLPPGPIPGPSPTSAPTAQSGYVQITVKPGETLLTYVKAYNVSARAIIDLNPQLWENPSLLRPGQVLTLPVSSLATVAPTITPTVTTPGTPAPTVAPTSTPAPNLTPIPGNYIQTTIRVGESLVTYVRRYGVSGSSILAVNPKLAANPSVIYPGQTIIIPVVVSFTPSRTTPFFHVVGAGETSVSLAAQYEMTTDNLLSANPGVAIVPGATILVPAGPHVYTVKEGDELRYIAQKYGVTVEFILQSNTIPNPDRIYPGQQILILTRYNAAPMPFTP
jgi:LysM repeat protein